MQGEDRAPTREHGVCKRGIDRESASGFAAPVGHQERPRREESATRPGHHDAAAADVGSVEEHRVAGGPRPLHHEATADGGRSTLIPVTLNRDEGRHHIRRQVSRCLRIARHHEQGIDAGQATAGHDEQCGPPAGRGGRLEPERQAFNRKLTDPDMTRGLEAGAHIDERREPQGGTHARRRLQREPSFTHHDRRRVDDAREGQLHDTSIACPLDRRPQIGRDNRRIRSHAGYGIAHPDHHRLGRREAAIERRVRRRRDRKGSCRGGLIPERGDRGRQPEHRHQPRQPSGGPLRRARGHRRHHRPRGRDGVAVGVGKGDQVGHEIGRALVPRGRILLHEPLEDLAERPRYVGPQRLDRRRPFLLMPQEFLHHAAVGERRPPREHEKHGAAE